MERLDKLEKKLDEILHTKAQSTPPTVPKDPLFSERLDKLEQTIQTLLSTLTTLTSKQVDMQKQADQEAVPSDYTKEMKGEATDITLKGLPWPREFSRKDVRNILKKNPHIEDTRYATFLTEIVQGIREFQSMTTNFENGSTQ